MRLAGSPGKGCVGGRAAPDRTVAGFEWPPPGYAVAAGDPAPLGAGAFARAGPPGATGIARIAGDGDPCALVRSGETGVGRATDGPGPDRIDGGGPVGPGAGARAGRGAGWSGGPAGVFAPSFLGGELVAGITGGLA